MGNGRYLLALPTALTLLGLSACNGNNSAAQTAGGDWIQNPVSTAPGPTPVNTSNLYTGPAEVAPFVQHFVDDAKAQGRDVTPDMQNPTLEIQLASLSSYGSSVIGLCESGGNMRRVTFEPTFWNSVDDTQKELLVHHELGHCVLYRAHRTDLLPSGADASIMYPVIMTDSTYTTNANYYLTELFALPNLSGIVADPNARTTYICNLTDVVP